MMFNKFDSLEPDFKKMLTASLVFHATIILFMTIKTVFLPNDIPEYQPAIKVDLVGLPDKRPQEMTAPIVEQKQETVIENQKPEERKKDISKTQDSALNKLKAQKAIEALKKSQKNETDSQKKALDKLIKGNQKSEGNSITGLAKLEFNQYIGTVDSHVKSNWSLPEWMKTLNLTAQVLIKIDSSGNITEKHFIKKSGNSEFDSNVEAALQKSNPFPPPPERLLGYVSGTGIIFAFPE